MKKHYLVRYDNDTNRGKYDTQPEAKAAAEQLARNAPGTTVAVYQVKEAYFVDTAVVAEVPLEN